MPVELIRDGLKSIADASRTAHAGLLIQRSLPIWEEGEKTQKGKLIEKITCVESNDLYELAFNRWLTLTGTQEQRFATLTAKVNGRLLTDLGTGGALETGASVHHSYGVPYIAASSVKGAVRSYAESIGLDQKYISILFGHWDEDNKASSGGEKLENTAGYLIWHDAWWIPKSVDKPFVKEIVTVHHQDYYSGKQSEATDFDSPVPNQQIGIQGSFYFAVEGDEQWIKFAIQLLENAITQFGLGAKGASGYGYFELDKEFHSKLQKQKGEAQVAAAAQREKKQLEAQLATLTDNQKLIKKFEANLPPASQWKNKPSQNVTVDVDGKKYQFIDIFDVVKEWDDIVDLKFAIEFFEKNLEIWSGKKLSKNDKWKDRINPLKRKAGLI